MLNRAMRYRNFHPFPWCRAGSEKEADVVVFGVADEKGSRALRAGSSGGPDAARKAAFEKDMVFRRQGPSVMHPEMQFSPERAFDAGNILKKEVYKFVRGNALEQRAVGCIGGDHSITYEICRGIASETDGFGFVYMDAHPDMIGSAGRYYGSVAHDLLKLKNVDAGSSFIIGTRASETEELENIRDSGVNVVTSEQIFKEGIGISLKRVVKKLHRNAYLSVDLDVMDPAFAPGVSTEVPGGLSSRELFYAVSVIGKGVSLGFDVMELNPKYDCGGHTAHVAALLLMRMASVIKKR